MIEIPKFIKTNVANTNGCVTSPLDLVLKLLQVQCANLDFYFLSSDYEVEFSVPEYCNCVVIFFLINHAKQMLKTQYSVLNRLCMLTECAYNMTYSNNFYL